VRQAFKPTARFASINQDASAALLCGQPPSVDFSINGRPTLPILFAKAANGKRAVLVAADFGHDVTPCRD
jgi:hypothetical protein